MFSKQSLLVWSMLHQNPGKILKLPLDNLGVYFKTKDTVIFKGIFSRVAPKGWNLAQPSVLEAV